MDQQDGWFARLVLDGEVKACHAVATFPRRNGLGGGDRGRGLASDKSPPNRQQCRRVIPQELATVSTDSRRQQPKYPIIGSELPRGLAVCSISVLDVAIQTYLGITMNTVRAHTSRPLLVMLLFFEFLSDNLKRPDPRRPRRVLP